MDVTETHMFDDLIPFTLEPANYTDEESYFEENTTQWDAEIFYELICTQVFPVLHFNNFSLHSEYISIKTSTHAHLKDALQAVR
jgi:hypothetical protein